MGRTRLDVLRGVDLEVSEGEWVAVLGASGSGKSTLLHLLGGLDRPGGGAIEFRGSPLGTMGRAELDRYRAASVGFVFQFYHLLPELRVLQNVTLGAMVRHGRIGFRGETRRAAEARARELLEAFGLGNRLGHRPKELSGGERQRVAIARALVNDPPVLLADEPTGNLDRRTGESIVDAIEARRRAGGLTIVMVTHDERIAARADRVVRLVDGLVEPEGDPAGIVSVPAGSE
ncbi:MAG: ABC transporter ATP-binding protein [Planctomycetota bacterium]